MTTPDKSLWLYANPSTIQYTILDDLEKHLGGGKKLITPNNVCTFLIEGFSNMSANMTQDILRALDDVFPKRALTMESVSRHMSDYDYVGLFSSPAPTDIEFIVRLSTLLDAPMVTEQGYHQIIIPKDSEFLIGRYTFSLYYPVVVRVVDATQTIAVLYDTTVDNPLYSIANQILESRVYMQNGVKLVSIKIPVHQFARKYYIEDVYANTPFAKKYSFDSKFYALRAFTSFKTAQSYPDVEDPAPDHNGDFWYELHQTLSSEVYDPETSGAPTIVVNVDTDHNTVTVMVPQVYISRGKMGSQVKIELLTTDGAIDIDTTTIYNALVPAKFIMTGNQEADKYTTVITRNGNVSVGLLNTRVVGGSDGISFNDLRKRVVYNTFNDQLLVLPLDIESYFGDVGYRVTKFKDGITSRIYLCHRGLTDLKGAVISSGDISTLVNGATLQDVDTIKSFTDGSFMVLPETTYLYDYTTNSCKPLTNAELASLEALSLPNKVATLNDNVYTFNPFYTRLAVINGIPVAYSYVLNEPKVNEITFLEESSGLTHLSIYHMEAEFSPKTSAPGDTDKYTLYAEVKYVSAESVDGTTVAFDPDNVALALAVRDVSDNLMYVTGTYVAGADDIHRFRFDIGTTYQIIGDNNLKLNFANGNGAIPLTTTMQLYCFVKSDIYPSSTGISSPLANIFTTYKMVSSNSLNVVFGEQIEELFNGVDIVFDNTILDTYDTTEHARYANTVYRRNPDTGVLLYTIDNGQVVLEVEHAAGDIVYNHIEEHVNLTSDNVANYYGKFLISNVSDDVLIDDEMELTEAIPDATIGTPVILHLAGDPMISSNGITPVIQAREVRYRVSMVHINKRILYSGDISTYANYADNDAYIAAVRNLILDNCRTVSTVKGRLLPNTDIYFRPSKSIGVSSFKVSSSIIEEYNLEIAVGVKLYVARRVIGDAELQTTLRNAVIKILDRYTPKEIFSLTEIAKTIVAELNDLVRAVDIEGIDGRLINQTLIHASDDSVLNLKHKLVIGNDGIVRIDRDVNLTFVAVDNEE
jgi:hypothetical protein